MDIEECGINFVEETSTIFDWQIVFTQTSV